MQKLQFLTAFSGEEFDDKTHKVTDLIIDRCDWAQNRMHSMTLFVTICLHPKALTTPPFRLFDVVANIIRVEPKKSTYWNRSADCSSTSIIVWLWMYIRIQGFKVAWDRVVLL